MNRRLDPYCWDCTVLGKRCEACAALVKRLSSEQSARGWEVKRAREFIRQLDIALRKQGKEGING